MGLGAGIVALAVGCSSGGSPFAEAVHAAAPQAISLGGPVLASPVIAPVVFAGDSDGATLVAFTGALVASPWWKSSLAEYGVGAATVDMTMQPAASPGMSTLADVDFRQMLRTAFADAKQQGKTVAWDSEIVVFFAPPGVTVTAPLGANRETIALCQQVGGYHSFVQLDATTRGIYAVVPRCDGFGGLTGLDAVTGIASHEIAEACTDPLAEDIDPSDPGAVANPAYALPDDLAWFVIFNGGEIGDMCASIPGAFYKDPAVSATIQHLWSNAAASAGHDPCGVSAPYFNAAPVLDTIKLDALGTPMSGPGLTIAVGSSRTVEVDLFSDAPTSGPWIMGVQDIEQLLGSAPSLDVSLSGLDGKNGDKLKLTVTAIKQGQLAGVAGLAGAVLTSRRDPEGSFWPILVKNQ
jgi:hypothetical protein